MSMTKKEAMAFAISTGKPIRHQTFSKDEYVIYVGKELHDEDVAKSEKEKKDLVDKIEQYKQFILKCNCKYLDVEVYSLEQYLDIDSWTYGMNYKDELLNLGFTKQEMDGFIADKYEEYLKDKEENTDD